MKLGRDTGSMTNYLMSGTNGAPVPTVGMGVTMLMWSDRHAGTITRVSPSGKTFWFQYDKAKLVGGSVMSEDQTYEFTPDPTSRVMVARLTKRGWKSGGTRVQVGFRSEYRDPTF